MRDLLREARQRLAREIDTRPVPLSEPIVADPWIVSSLLQKSIRRGESGIAQRAALTSFRLRGSAIWRRFMVIAFEDVGAGSVDAVVMTVAAGSDAAWRTACGGDSRIAAFLAKALAEAPKDRSADYLACAKDHPSLKAFARAMENRSIQDRLSIMRGESLDLPQRAVAAFFASGLGSNSEGERIKGDLSALFAAFAKLGLPDELLAATEMAARRMRETITVMVPLIWLQATQNGAVRVSNDFVPKTEIVDEIPLYAFDKHTRIGKRATRELVGAETPLRDCLNKFVARSCWQAAAEMAAFYADAVPIARRLEWSLSHSVQALGREADFYKAGVPLVGITPLRSAMDSTLGKLNDIRRELWIVSRATQPS
jgi:hypothetical protein